MGLLGTEVIKLRTPSKEDVPTSTHLGELFKRIY